MSARSQNLPVASAMFDVAMDQIVRVCGSEHAIDYLNRKTDAIARNISLTRLSAPLDQTRASSKINVASSQATRTASKST